MLTGGLAALVRISSGNPAVSSNLSKWPSRVPVIPKFSIESGICFL
jgi:hypothetical protein